MHLVKKKIENENKECVNDQTISSGHRIEITATAGGRQLYIIACPLALMYNCSNKIDVILNFAE